MAADYGGHHIVFRIEVYMNDTENSEIFEREAAAFSLIGAVLKSLPEKKWLKELASTGVFLEIPYALEQKDAQAGQTCLSEWAASYDDGGFDAIYSDYMNLFIGPGKPLAPPWESTFDDNTEGLVFQQKTLEVRKAYRTFGLQVDDMYHEPDDHIGYEFEFFSRLSEAVAKARAEGDIHEAERILGAQKAFLDEHLLAWAFDWCDLVGENAATDFYRGMALLVRGFLCEAGAMRKVESCAGLPLEALAL